MELIGKTTINPFIFYTGKTTGYLIWLLYVLTALNIYAPFKVEIPYLVYAANVLGILGTILVVWSMFDLGSSVRLGLPQEKTILKTSGFYRISRNPIYTGFNLLTIAGVMITGSWIVAICAVYSIVTYHLIIRGEEAFLIQAFGKEYKEFCRRVRRYL